MYVPMIYLLFIFVLCIIYFLLFNDDYNYSNSIILLLFYFNTLLNYVK